MAEKDLESARAKGHEFFQVHPGGLWSAMMVRMAGGRDQLERILTRTPERPATPPPAAVPTPQAPATQPTQTPAPRTQTRNP